MSADDYDPMAEFSRVMNKRVGRSYPVKSDSDIDSDSRLNIRNSSALKSEFEALCKREHSTLSAEIKRFIVQSVKRNSLP